MPVHAGWKNHPKHFFYVEFHAPWTWDEYYSARDLNLVDSTSNVIHFVYDFSESDGKLPQASLVHFRNEMSRAIANTGTIIIVSPRLKLASTIISIVVKIIKGYDIRLVSTYQDALNIVQKLNV